MTMALVELKKCNSWSIPNSEINACNCKLWRPIHLEVLSGPIVASNILAIPHRTQPAPLGVELMKSSHTKRRNKKVETNAQLRVAVRAKSSDAVDSPLARWYRKKYSSPSTFARWY